MNYQNGKKIRVGDLVDLGHGSMGLIIGILQEDAYDIRCNPADWTGLETGLVVRTDFGDIWVKQPDEDMEPREP
jgi:hypothetical protein